MIPMYSAEVITVHGTKSISVFAEDILNLDEEIDILTTSAFTCSYSPTPNTMFAALHEVGISVKELAKKPLIDLRTPCGIWLSHEVASPALPVKRIGCVELRGYGKSDEDFLSTPLKKPPTSSSFSAKTA